MLPSIFFCQNIAAQCFRQIAIHAGTEKPATLKHRDLPAAESASLFKMKSARSTEYPLRRLAVRGCERTMSGA